MNRLIMILLLLCLTVGVPLAVWGQANLPFSPNSVQVQGPDPSGQLGYPLATVPATGALPWPVSGTVTANGGSPGADRSVAPVTFTASGTLIINSQGCATVNVLVISGAGWTGSIGFNGSVDGTNFAPVLGSLASSSNSVYSTGIIPTATIFPVGSPRIITIECGGYSVIQVNIGVTAGSVTVGLGAGAGKSRSPAGDPGPGYPILPYTGVFGLDTSAGQWSAIPTKGAPLIDLLSVNDRYLICVGVNYQYTGGTRCSMVRTPVSFQTVAAAAAGNTALWTPAAGKKFRLMRYMVTMTDQSTQAAPGTLTVSLFDGAAGVTGQVHDVFVPAVALVNSGSLYTSGWIDLGNGYLSTAANNILNVNLSAALTAGTVRVICCGTEE